MSGFLWDSQFCFIVFWSLHCFDYYSFVLSSETGTWGFRNFFFKIIVANWDLLQFNRNLRFGFISLFFKKLMEFWRNCIESLDYFEEYCHFSNTVFQTMNMGFFLLICSLLNFFQQCFIAFSQQIFYLVIEFIPRYFLLSDAILKRITNDISFGLFAGVWKYRWFLCVHLVTCNCAEFSCYL